MAEILVFESDNNDNEKIAESKKLDELEKPEKAELLKLIDAAAKGNIEAAEKIALGYFSGSFGEKNLAKAKKWASYAAKHGSEAASELLTKLSITSASAR